MSGCREFFLNPKGTWLKVTDVIRHDKPESHVHVIEYKAVADLEEKLKVVVEALEFYKEQAEILEEEIETTLDCHKPTYYCNRCKELAIEVIENFKAKRRERGYL